MSQLTKLKSQLNTIAAEAKTTAAGLTTFKSKFSKAVGQVSTTIGGSAQRTDKQIIEALQTAEKQVASAAQALQQAAQTASRYASSL